MKYGAEQMEQEALMASARRICAAARTAPKAKGWDYIETLVLTGEDKDAVAQKMDEICKTHNIAFFARDAQNVRDAGALALIAIRPYPRKLNCGYCGFETCALMEQAGARCAFDSVDLGIAIGSAASIAADDRVDNRIFYSAGRAAMALGLVSEGATALGIVLSLSGKNKFFDRK